MGGVDALDTKHPNPALFEACDEMANTRLAKLDGGQIQHYRFPNKKAGRARNGRVDLFEPAHDRHHRAKYEGDVGATPKANQLACWLRGGVHRSTHFLIEWLRIGGLG
jgi:hypothetical protein